MSNHLIIKHSAWSDPKSQNEKGRNRCLNHMATEAKVRKILDTTKGAFPNQDSLLKLLYMGIQNAQ